MKFTKICIAILMFFLLAAFISCYPSENVQIIQVLIWKGNLDEAPDNPEKGWAYYNSREGISYVYTGSSWEIIAKDGVGIIWKGELTEAPEDPERNWAYFNRLDGNSYIFDGTEWNFLAKSGSDGTSGILKWLGELSTYPSSPSEGDAFYNSSEGVSYIYSNGSWSILSRDGVDSTFNWLGSFSDVPSSPNAGDAYYNTSDNTSYIFNGISWDILVANSDVYYNVPISWQGDLREAPSSPSVGWAYHNTSLGASYIWDGTTWQKISQDGYTPEGFLINWQGSLDSPPMMPEKGWAYYDLRDNTSYIFDGYSWTLLAKGSSDGNIGYGELEVTVDGMVIDPGTYLDMGTFGENGDTTPLSKTIKVRNIGEKTVSFYRNGPVLTSYYENSDYSLDKSGFKTSLFPGEEISFEVAFSTKYGNSPNSGTTHTLHLFSDAMIDNYFFNLRANSVLPAFYVSYAKNTIYLVSGMEHMGQDHIDLGEVSSDTSVNLSLVEYANVPDDYSVTIEGVDKECFSLKSNQNTVLTIALRSDTLGEKSAVIVISNDSFRYTVPIYADFQTISDQDPDEDPGSFIYGKFNSKGEIFFDGGEGDGDDRCYYVLSDGNGGLYLIGTAYEKVKYSSEDDTWVIHLNEKDEVVGEWLFDDSLFRSNYNSSILDGILLADGRIALVTNDGSLVVLDESNIVKHAVDATKVISMDNDGFWIMSYNYVRRYNYNGQKVREYGIPSASLLVSDVVFIDDSTIAVGGYVGNHEDSDSGEDAVLITFDISSGDLVEKGSWYFDAGHGDDDRITSMVFFDGKLIVEGTSYDLLSSRSEIDGWIRGFYPVTLIPDETLYAENDSTYPSLFVYDNDLYAGTNSSTWKFSYPALSDYSVETYLFEYSREFYDVIIIDGYLYVPGYASEYQTGEENGEDWVVKRFEF